jgi:uncharacterized membrane protein
LSNAFKLAFAQLTAAPMPTGAVASSSGMFGFPQVFTAASWINLLLTGIANLFLIIGVLLIFLRPKGTGISAQYRVMSIVAALILAVTFIEPSIGSILNFTRFYAIILLFLAPCFVLGGHAFLVTIGKVWKKIKRPLKHQIASKSKNIDIAFLLMAIILGGYFLSQTGFVTRVASDTISNHPIDFERMIVSNETQVKIGFYDNYISEQDVYSASWLLNHNAETAEIFADYLSASHVLLSYGLIPNELLLPITNTTIPPQGSFIYLSSLNIGNDAITTLTGSFNTSEISSLLNQNNLVYSNGNGEIWYVTSAP